MQYQIPFFLIQSLYNLIKSFPIKVSPLPFERGLFLTSHWTSFNQQPPFDLENLAADLLLAQLLLIVSP
jgi:hypothetical protein